MWIEVFFCFCFCFCFFEMPGLEEGERNKMSSKDDIKRRKGVITKWGREEEEVEEEEEEEEEEEKDTS